MQNKPSQRIIYDKRHTPSHQRKELLRRLGILHTPPSQAKSERRVQMFLNSQKEKEIKNKAPSKKKDPETRQAELLQKYMSEFRWLEIKNKNQLFCTYCIKYCNTRQIFNFHHEQDRFFIQQGSTKIKKDGLCKHSQRILHLKATWCFGSEVERNELEKLCEKEGQSLKNLLREEREKYSKEEIFPIFSIAYFVSKNDLALLDGEDLLKLLDFHQVKTPSHYRNRHAIKEAILNISESVKSNILRDSMNAVE